MTQGYYIDPVELTAQLIRCPSVAPDDAGALGHVEAALLDAGFECFRVERGSIQNLYARWGEKAAPLSFGFNGHTDVVPVGDPSDWSVEPFGGEIKEDTLYGRGACDMKSGVAAFVSAAVQFVRDTPPEKGAVVLAITGDEEAAAVDGTRALLDWMAQRGEQMSVCLVGEPTCPEQLGEMMKIGRRGSLSAFFEVIGVQGHSAYPHRANNPIPAMMRLMDRLAGYELDRGTEHFDPSTLAVVTVDTGNPATNVIPASCRATVNIRFNDAQSSSGLTTWLEQEVKTIENTFGVEVKLRVTCSGESFITPPGALSNLVHDAVFEQTGLRPELSTSGGTSDARFVQHHCPVVEFGLVGQTMHQVDECVSVQGIRDLTAIYHKVLERYFSDK